MRTLKIIECIAITVLLSTMAGFTCSAQEPPFEFYGKSLTIYPIGYTMDGQPMAAEMEFDTRVAELIGTMLERLGMLPSISSASPRKIRPDDSLLELEKKLLAFQARSGIESDYVLYVRMDSLLTESGPMVTRLCVVMSDVRGQIVWARDDSEMPRINPMDVCHLIARTLKDHSDLREPDPDNVPYGEMARMMDERSGLPPLPERDDMDERFASACDSFSNTSLTIYPFRIWKKKKGSFEGAGALAEKLNEDGLFMASVADSDTCLKAKRDPNQMKIMWDTAKSFRQYLTEHPAEADYALLVDATIPAHHLHLILCTGTGDWVMVDLQNSHHDDFNEFAPKTVDDCVALAHRRLQRRIGGNDQE